MNATGMGRSNYFKVKDKDSFDKFAERNYLTIINKDEDEDMIGFILEDGYIPSYYYDEEAGVDVDYEDETEFLKELSTHLEKDYIAVVMSVIFEGNRYCQGVSYSVNNNGDINSVDLNQIYDNIDINKKEFTFCSY